MSDIVRESVVVTPISSERMDVTGAVHRYNFGWIKIHRVVGGDPGDGEVIESTSTGISGMSRVFDENVTEEILPPSLETPDVTGSVSATGISVSTFYKIGIKKRAIVRTRAAAPAELIILGALPFSIMEDKLYADAIGNGSEAPTPEGGPESADGGVTITAANGVITTTKIKG